jgi:hypothetical protein
MKNSIHEMSLVDLYVIRKFLKKRLEGSEELHKTSNEFHLLKIIENRIESISNSVDKMKK